MFLQPYIFVDRKLHWFKHLQSKITELLFSVGLFSKISLSLNYYKIHLNLRPPNRIRLNVYLIYHQKVRQKYATHNLSIWIKKTPSTFFHLLVILIFNTRSLWNKKVKTLKCIYVCINVCPAGYLSIMN